MNVHHLIPNLHNLQNKYYIVLGMWTKIQKQVMKEIEQGINLINSNFLLKLNHNLSII